MTQESIRKFHFNINKLRQKSSWLCSINEIYWCIIFLKMLLLLSLYLFHCRVWNVICLEKIIVSIRRISILFLIHSLKYLTADISHELWSDGNLSISSLSLAISYAKLFFSLDFNTWRQNRLRININFSSASTAISTSASRNNHPHPQ